MSTRVRKKKGENFKKRKKNITLHARIKKRGNPKKKKIFYLFKNSLPIKIIIFPIIRKLF